ncbi:MAG TPA: GNAT family N-acetyltransferase [Gaiellaceae bacterium]|nr:GNAT family N-acetyltransferase [Gaiellaceae bacterium]
MDVILRDGGTMRLRPPTRDDAAALSAFFSGLSERSLYQRFHGFPTIGPHVVEPLVDPDWSDRGALVGSIDGRIVAVANYGRLRDPASAEVAFTVADEYQRRGIGTRLLEQLAAVAGAHGIERFVAAVLPDNRPMLSVFADAGFEVSRDVAGGEAEVTFPIASTEMYRERVEERDHLAVVASLRPFFTPATVAVIGASPRRGSIGGELFRNVIEAEFTGAVFPVNRGGESVAGVRGYASITEIPDAVDLAVICVPGERVIDAAQEALGKGVHALCVISAGFAEVGADGVERQDRLLSIVRDHGARLIGPNCLGVAVAEPRLNATFAAKAPPWGSIGFSSQSGALGLAMIEKAEGRGIGLSSFVSIGNKADVSSNDLLEYYEEDARTKVVALYLESFGNPRKFARIARRLSRTKPILAMKSGRTGAGAKAAGSHTAALTSSDVAVDALFRQAGVVRAETLEELVDLAVLFSTQPLPRGRRVAIITNAGGLGILAADACDAAGLELPPLGEETTRRLREVLPTEASVANPVDMLGSATAATYERTLPHVLADPGVDAVIVLFVPPVTAGADEVAVAVSRASEGSTKPVLSALMDARGIPHALSQAGVPGFSYPESAARALGRAAARSEWLREPAGAVPDLDDVDRAAARAIVDGSLRAASDRWLEPEEARALLEAYGIPVVAQRIASSLEEALAVADELGYPVVVKTALAGAHKTETGGVAVDLQSEDDVREATARIGGEVLVQPMVKGSAELLAGVVQDDVFGALVALGPGGVFAELIGDAGLCIAPLTDVEARRLVTSGKTGTLVRGFRGKPAADEASLVDLLHRLSALGDELPEVAELDLNPVVAAPDGCVAVDARVRVRRPEARTRTKTW